MALSEGLAKLAARATEAEEHARAAQATAKAELEQDIARAWASTQAEADKLRTTRW